MFDQAQYLVLSIGLLVALLYALLTLFNAAAHIAKRYDLSLPALQRLVATSNTHAEARLKCAARRKLNTVLLNAHSLHNFDEPGALLSEATVSGKKAAKSGKASDPMRAFVLHGEHLEPAGGLLWTWLRILDGSLFDCEGIWINTRLIIFQAIQIVIGAFLVYVLFGSVEIIANKAEEARKDITPETPKWLADFVPTRQMVYRALYPASAAATLVLLLLILVYIPRSVLVWQWASMLPREAALTSQESLSF